MRRRWRVYSQDSVRRELQTARKDAWNPPFRTGTPWSGWTDIAQDGRREHPSEALIHGWKLGRASRARHRDARGREVSTPARKDPQITDRVRKAVGRCRPEVGQTK